MASNLDEGFPRFPPADFGHPCPSALQYWAGSSTLHMFQTQFLSFSKGSEHCTVRTVQMRQSPRPGIAIQRTARQTVSTIQQAHSSFPSSSLGEKEQTSCINHASKFHWDGRVDSCNDDELSQYGFEIIFFYFFDLLLKQVRDHAFLQMKAARGSVGQGRRIAPSTYYE